MQKKKSELLKILGEQCFGDYGEETEIIGGLKEIAKFNLPEWIVGYDGTCMALIHAFSYGAMMGIRHERKKRKEKANKRAELPFVTCRMMTDAEWNRLAYRNQMEQKGGVS